MTLPASPVIIPFILIAGVLAIILYGPQKIIRWLIGFPVCLVGELFKKLNYKGMGELVIEYGCWIAGWTRAAWDAS